MKATASLLVSLAVLAGAARSQPPAPVVLRVSSFQLGAGGKDETRFVMRENATWEITRILHGAKPRPRSIPVRSGTCRETVLGRFGRWKDQVEGIGLPVAGESYGTAPAAGVNEHWIRVESRAGWVEVRGIPIDHGGRKASDELRIKWHGEWVDRIADLVAEMERLISTRAGGP